MRRAPTSRPAVAAQQLPNACRTCAATHPLRACRPRRRTVASAAAACGFLPTTAGASKQEHSMVCRTKSYQRLSGLIVAACLAGSVGATVHPSRSSAHTPAVRLAADVATSTLMPAAGQYVPLSPQRIATIASLASGGTSTFSPSATTGVPATGVSALVFSLTATNTTNTSGVLKSYAAGAVQPAATSLSYGS